LKYARSRRPMRLMLGRRAGSELEDICISWFRVQLLMSKINFLRNI